MIGTGQDEWRDRLQPLRQQALTQTPHTPRTARFRFADAVVEIVSDCEPLFEELNAFYGDCADIEPDNARTRLRCTATLLLGSQCLSLRFDGDGVRDPLDVALGQYRFLRRPPFVEVPGPVAGWRLLVHAMNPDRFLIASDGRAAVVNLAGAPPEFAMDCIVGVAQSAQSGVLFLHGASVGIAGSGALLLGASQAGKSTNALALAWRGHVFLGDDVAAVRLATRELLPFPKSAGLRSGPLANLLAARVQACAHIRAPARDGVLRTVVRASDLFPDSTSGPLPLRYAFLLDDQKGAARITSFQPGHADLMRLRSMVVMDTTSTWGLSPGRDLMQLLGVVDLLSGLQCFLVEPGSTEETASLIESAMRE